MTALAVGAVRLGAAGAAGYLLGTVSSADLVCRAMRTEVDLRHQGSANPGAANAIQLLGPAWGSAVLAGDIAKGALASVLGRLLAGDTGGHLGGTGAVVGHCYPVWSRFRGGGKGVAASTGQCLATFPAYFPIDAAVAYATARWRQRAAAAAVASATWVASGVLWWRRGWPNLWGPRPGPALPICAAASSAAILARFWQGRDRGERGWRVGPCTPASELIEDVEAELRTR